MIEAAGVVKSFGPRTILRGIDLKAETGETLVIIGGYDKYTSWNKQAASADSEEPIAKSAGTYRVGHRWVNG